MSAKKVLLVEDETDIRQLIALQLKREGFVVDAVADGEEGLERLARENYHLLILDWMLPGLSGLQITQNVRLEKSESKTPKDVPILMVTAKAEGRDIIEGLDEGADDYLTKPFEITVLKARVSALLRRTDKRLPAGDASNVRDIVLGTIRINPDAHEVYNGDLKLSLTLSEFKLLSELARNQGRVLTRDYLMRRVQGEDISVTQRTIDTHVFGLRKKMGDQADLIETIRGVGYRIPV